MKEDVEIYGVENGGAFFDVLAFKPVTEVRFGTAAVNSLRGPGWANLDMSLFRTFGLPSNMSLQLRVEALNVTNTPHFANPASNVSNLQLNPDGTVRNLNGFGVITSTTRVGRQYDEREWRLGREIDVLGLREWAAPFVSICRAGLRAAKHVPRCDFVAPRRLRHARINGYRGVCMTQKFGAVLVVCAAIGLGFATRTLNGQAQATQAHAAEFQQDVLPVLAKSCLGCHSEKAQAGKLNLEPLRDPATTATHTDVWQKVLDKVSAGAMPPRNREAAERRRARGSHRVDQEASRV